MPEGTPASPPALAQAENPPAFALADSSRLSRDDAQAFAAYALRTRAPGAQEVLAAAASGTRLGWAAYLEGVAGGHDATTDPVWGAWAAYVHALLPESDPATALALLDHAAAAGPLPTKVADVWAQCLLRAGRRADAAAAAARPEVSDLTRWEVECDLANPHLWPDEQLDPHAWLGLLSRPFVEGGVEEVTVAADAPTPFGRLAADAPALPAAETGDGDPERMVTVVMSAYQPDRDIVAAVRSILDQTWTNLELLVVDDQSPDPDGVTAALLEEVAAMDSRVRVLAAPANGGTYQIRNLALREARGAFMTFQDSDDWSHPRRLEVQVRALLADPSVLATRTPAVRAYPDLSLTFPGYPAQRPNASSLLFRRREVHELIGDFDAVRKSADMEYPRRLQAIRPKSVRDVDSHGPMAITQLRSGSLSRADAVPGWIRWTRLSYHDAYVEWHERLRARQADPRVVSGPDSQRPFPMPDPTWSPWRESAQLPRERFDVVVLGDWRSGRAPHRQVLDEIRLLADRGLRVGIAHAEAPFPLAPKRQDRSRAVQRLVNAGVVELTHLDRPADVGLLLVADADVLPYLPGVDVGLRPGAVVVSVDATGLATADGTAAVRAAFGVEPTWALRHESASLSSPDADTDAPLLPYAAEPVSLRVTDRRLLGPEPVVGHHLPDAAERWPDRASVLAAYPAERDVRLLHGTSAVARLLGRATHPVGWTSFDGVGLPTRTFLSRLDFFVYLGVRDHVADHSLREAMAAGCVPVVPEDFRPVAGEGAAYVSRSGGEAAAAVQRLWDDPQEYARLQNEAAAVVSGGPDWVTRLLALGPAELRERAAVTPLPERDDRSAAREAALHSWRPPAAADAAERRTERGASGRAKPAQRHTSAGVARAARARSRAAARRLAEAIVHVVPAKGPLGRLSLVAESRAGRAVRVGQADPAAGLAIAREVMRSQPTLPHGWRAAVAVSRGAKDHAAALEVARDALTAGVEDAQLLLDCAELASLLGDDEASAVAAQAISQFQPRTQAELELLARALRFGTGQDAEAVRARLAGSGLRLDRVDDSIAELSIMAAAEAASRRDGVRPDPATLAEARRVVAERPDGLRLAVAALRSRQARAELLALLGDRAGPDGAPRRDPELPTVQLARSASRAFAAGWTRDAAALARWVLAQGGKDPEMVQIVHEDEEQERILASGWPVPERATEPAYEPVERSVLSLLGQSLPIRSGGYATRSHGILTGVAATGWTVRAATRLGFPYDLWWSADDPRPVAPVDVVDDVPYHRLLRDGVRHYPRFPLPDYVRDGADAVVELAQEHRPALVHASSLYDVGLTGLAAARRLGVPFVYEVRGLKQLLEEARLPRFRSTERSSYLDLLELTVAREADAVFVITDALARELITMGVPEDRVVIVPNGVHAERFEPRPRDAELEAALGLRGKTVIGYAGGFVGYEGLELLLEAVDGLRRDVADFHVVLVGDGARDRTLRALAAKLGLDDVVTFTGRVGHDVVDRYISLFDITPFPRLALPVCELVSPIKPFEAMAMGKAVVVSDVAALTEIVQDGVTGRSFAKGDVADLRRVLGELVADAGQRQRLGEAAREWVVAERDWSAITRTVVAGYERVLGGS